MKIEIYWNDLTQKKQDEILEKIKYEDNWDTMPIATIEIEGTEDKN